MYRERESKLRTFDSILGSWYDYLCSSVTVMVTISRIQQYLHVHCKHEGLCSAGPLSGVGSLFDLHCVNCGMLLVYFGERGSPPDLPLLLTTLMTSSRITKAVSRLFSIHRFSTGRWLCIPADSQAPLKSRLLSSTSPCNAEPVGPLYLTL